MKNIHTNIHKISVGIISFFVVSGIGFGSAPGFPPFLAFSEIGLPSVSEPFFATSQNTYGHENSWTREELKALLRSIFDPNAAKMTKAKIANQLIQNGLVNHTQRSTETCITSIKGILKKGPMLLNRLIYLFAQPFLNRQGRAEREGILADLEKIINSKERGYSEKTLDNLPSYNRAIWPDKEIIRMLQIADANQLSLQTEENSIVLWPQTKVAVFAVLREKNITAVKIFYSAFNQACKARYGVNLFDYTNSQIKEKGYENLPRNQAVKLVWKPLIKSIRAEMRWQRKGSYEKRKQKPSSTAQVAD
ncbi:MAG: hypothetical protein LBR92_01405 [Puniceicoccales bacterium]|jgi:hypothetical protein|nr:hypothetical protein [Puniceicoccales bacterium]